MARVAKLLVAILGACLLVALALYRVQQPTVTQDCAIFDDPLRALPIDSLTLDTAVEWAGSHYNVPPEAIRKEEREREGPPRAVTGTVRWDAEDNGYYISFHEERAIYATVVWVKIRPSLRAVLDCLGPPTRYSSHFSIGPGGWLIEFELWYPEEGVALTYSSPVRGERVPTIRYDLPLEEMRITRPGDLESVVRAAYWGRNEGLQQHRIDNALPWPQDIADLQITTEPRSQPTPTLSR